MVHPPTLRRKPNKILSPGHSPYYYFVHSFMVPLPEGAMPEYVLTTTDYGIPFVSSVQLVSAQLVPSLA